MSDIRDEFEKILPIPDFIMRLGEEGYQVLPGIIHYKERSDKCHTYNSLFIGFKNGSKSRDKEIESQQAEIKKWIDRNNLQEARIIDQDVEIKKLREALKQTKIVVQVTFCDPHKIKQIEKIIDEVLEDGE